MPQTLESGSSFLQTPEGVRLFCRRWESATPRAVALIAHGLGEHSGRYESLAKALIQRGLTVWAMDHRGHGRSDGRRGDCRSIQQFAEDLNRWVEEAFKRFPQLPRVLIGHSLGGLIALRYAVTYGRSIRAVAVSSPAIRLAQPPPRMKVALAKGLAGVLPTTPIPNGVDPHLLCRDPQVVKEYQTDPLVHRGITARCAVALQQAMAESQSLAEKLTIPCLILQGGDDRICDPKAAEQFAKTAPSGAVTFHRYEGLYHELFNEPEREMVIEDLCVWLKEQVG